MEIGPILARISRVAEIIALDAKSPWNLDRAREIQRLVKIAQGGVKADGKWD